jgi:hypothetical protein
LRQINGWLFKAYMGVNGCLPEARSLEGDILVLSEFHRQFLTNSDTTNIATSIEQIVFNR